MLISIYFLITFKHYVHVSNVSSIVYGSALYWQIALVGYSILATAVQPLKRAATSFSTHTKMSVCGPSKSSRSGQSIQLRSLSRTKHLSHLNEAAPPLPPAMAWSSVQAGMGAQDRDSVESQGSRDHIVKKMDVQVSYSNDEK